MSTRRAVITGLGFITGLGNDQATVTESLRKGRHAMRTVVLADNPDLPVKVFAPAPGFELTSPSWRDWTWPAGYDLPREVLRGMGPHGVMGFCAAEQAIADAGLSSTGLDDGRTALFCASSGSPLLQHHHLAQMHETRFSRGNPMSVVSAIAGSLNFNLSAHYHIRGAVAGFASACASSSQAIGYATDEIRLGRHDRVLVVAAEELNAETILPFSHMRALSVNPDPATASRPFDRQRDGFVGAGAAVALIVEDAAVAASRGRRAYCEVLGWGQSADGHSIAAPHPEGAGMRSAIEHALADAGLDPAAIDYVNAHATSTPAGDKAELQALGAVFSEAGARPRVSSTKGLTGHPLSVAGGLEAAICCLALTGQFIPGNHHLVDPDPAADGLDLPRETLDHPLRTLINNSSGFGGSNIVHVLRRAE